MPWNIYDSNISGTLMLNSDFKELLDLLNSNRAEYLLVGGYAVAIHGYPRYTGDMDIWINPTSENLSKVLEALAQFGFSSLGLTIDDLKQPYSVIQLGFPPNRIDIINDLDGVDFQECYKHRISHESDGTVINLISVDDLIKNKKATARLKDLDDAEHLQG